MKWSLDTHKFMSEITRKALQILVKNNITSSSSESDIEKTEKELSNAGVYRDETSAQGRIRRALFTYFRFYGCWDDTQTLTEIGKLFVENKITVREFCLNFIVNYSINNELSNFYPLRIILLCLKKLSELNENEAYITNYDFSQLVDLNGYNDLTGEFINNLLIARNIKHYNINDRAIGFDVWSNILISSGLFKKNHDRNLILKNKNLSDWLLATYEKMNNEVNIQKCGIFAYLPTPKLGNINSDVTDYQNESRTLQAYLFSKSINNLEIERYIYNNSGKTYNDFLNNLGLIEDTKGFYENFADYERLVGFYLTKYNDEKIKKIGSILLSTRISEKQITQSLEKEKIEDIIIGKNNINSIIDKNVILYGVPGSGKSYTIDNEYKTDGCIEKRVVFHPDYTYSDFVGQLLPDTDKDGRVKYKFVPGPFTEILKSAYSNPDKNHILIIEEINRGNAPAIFGDIFQLLDRNEDGSSMYEITNKDIYDIVHEKDKDKDEDNTETDNNDSEYKVTIPSNLSIIATMNTSDQNVFTLDTAFQRRWEMRLIENVFTEKHEFKNKPILDTGITWQKFCETINKTIIENSSGIASTEDKRLGVYFVKEDYLEDGDYNQKRRFPEKVIKYLWDDAFKFNRENMFSSKYQSLEEIIRKFIEKSGFDRFDIFNDNVKSRLQSSDSDDQIKTDITDGN